MLTEPQAGPRRQATQSLRQAYAEFVEQRIEEFKEQLSRQQLLALGDEAVREMEEREGQLFLTEVLVHDYVDRIIKKRLRIPTFRRWRERHLHLRHAQQTPNHWGLDADTPLSGLVRCLEDEDVAVVVGAGSAPVGMYMAAHDARVLLIDQDLAKIEAAETLAASESLSNRFLAMVVSLGDWFPDEVRPSLVVLDALTLGHLVAHARVRLVETLKFRTVPGGVHLIGTAPRSGDVIPIAPDALQGQYHGWTTERGRKSGRTRWFTARKP